ncbi:division/cell wall cluster transcriptional repressor MraZ [Pseudoprimorskyibacter insulae]|uniref:Transcriptional regulator MraZ n=1 Tax=Pseudoprimorskyibacter insulae TaxID=1695997 RepID=A0A2R8AR74_9RHOB|nr:division/cell wall cluster transcriptional repressor MraZ [Pseudoprimorskyibacter insulae]SPF78377.1 Transcriptional regulator MraZ [Pseudoprimorskyibacter insulae]
MSVPSEFRSVLKDGDPKCPDENANPRIVVLFGPHVLKKGCLHAYTIEAMREIEEGIRQLPRGSKQREVASRTILSRTWEAEIDRDGRIVLPKERREAIGLEGEATMVAMGEYFEIWNADRYAEQEQEVFDDILEEYGEDFDPLSLLP